MVKNTVMHIQYEINGTIMSFVIWKSVFTRLFGCFITYELISFNNFNQERVKHYSADTVVHTNCTSIKIISLFN